MIGGVFDAHIMTRFHALTIIDDSISLRHIQIFDRLVHVFKR